MALIPGVYGTSAKRHQILAGLDMVYESDPEPTKGHFRLGSAHLAYRLGLNPGLVLWIDAGYSADDETDSFDLGFGTVF